MDAFVVRKKRKLSAPHPTSLVASSSRSSPSTSAALGDVQSILGEEEEPTDFKLAILSSVYPKLEQSVLLDILLAHDGSVEEASASLNNHESKAKKSTVMGHQSSLSGYIAPSVNQGQSPKKKKLLSKRGKTLHLYSPGDVAEHTPCSIIHNFLPVEEANALLKELLTEATTYQRDTFKLFDNVVQSPHTSCFYVEGSKEQDIQKTEYVYNGGRVEDVRQLTPQMRRIAATVQEAVNREVVARIMTHHNGRKLRYQSPNMWKPNAAFVNCYSGGAESVGYHSDQLTYLGPRAIIGSISLGVAREFRVRRIVPQDDDKIGDKQSSDAEGQIAIHLPHNSFLIMHAEMQEEWKHSIAPAQAIDPHPIAGNKRINITYRDYKSALHPRFTPRCSCGIPCILRVVQRKKENWGKYFWMCYAGSVPGKDGCTYFEWAEFDDDGNPVWKQEKGKAASIAAEDPLS
ncbi:hypothetical protein B0O99DRAFT_617945 [Bisporella sp. PMI_857]|nr:hypothetical protein B0O99DRAFT_617945 [Bisporella sp. PMI_857]